MSARSGTNRSYAERKRAGRPTVTLTLTTEVLARLDAMAEAHGESRSGMVEALILRARKP